MAVALQRGQLNRLCSNAETLEKALSILRLANAKTRPGSGFVVKNPVAIPAVCAYLASQELNTGEVSMQSAMSAACVSKSEFADILKKVSTALRAEEGETVGDVTYETLVDAYRVHPRDDSIACMEDAEAALPQVNMLKERYGANVLSCAIFYWVCQLLEEPSVQERSLRQAYSIHPRTFKAVTAILDKQCDSIADQIKSYLLQKRSSIQESTSSQSIHVAKPAPTSPAKSPLKSAVKTRTMTREMSTPAATPSKRRTLIFSNSTLDDGANSNNAPFPETPTKKRRVDSLSPAKLRTSNPPAKPSTAVSVTAFHAALKGNAARSPAVQESKTPGSGPSTPRRPRLAKVLDATATPVQASPQTSPSRSQAQASPTRLTRHRFRPVFLEQQQWYARDPKVERIWAAAEVLRNEMVALHGHPFQRNGSMECTV